MLIERTIELIWRFFSLLCVYGTDLGKSSSVEFMDRSAESGEDEQVGRKDKQLAASDGIEDEERLWDALPKSLLQSASGEAPRSRLEALKLMQNQHQYMRNFLQPAGDGKVPL